MKRTTTPLRVCSPEEIELQLRGQVLQVQELRRSYERRARWWAWAALFLSLVGLALSLVGLAW